MELLKKLQLIDDAFFSICFDVFATDTQGKLYNIEVQRADSGAIPQRARYNSVMPDYHELKKQEGFKDLPESFVIFITENDVIGDGEKIYHADRINSRFLL